MKVLFTEDSRVGCAEQLRGNQLVPLAILRRLDHQISRGTIPAIAQGEMKLIAKVQALGSKLQAGHCGWYHFNVSRLAEKNTVASMILVLAWKTA